MIEFAPLRREDMPKLLKWRQASPGAWRDPIPTTIERQEEWYRDIVSHQDWISGVYNDEHCFIAQTQLWPIDWHNQCAEIGLIVSPDWRGQGWGRKIVEMTLRQGFHNLGMNMIFGEAYYCTDAWKFWSGLDAKNVVLPQRKYWDGKFWDSLYFWWLASEWEGK